MGKLGRTSPVEPGRVLTLPRRRGPGSDHEAGGRRHLPVDVAAFDFGVPHRPVDLAELPDRGLVSAEGGGERRVLRFGPGLLDAVGQDPMMIEGQLFAMVEQVVDGGPLGGGGVASCGRLGRLGKRERGRRPRRLGGVAVVVSVGGELVELSNLTMGPTTFISTA